MCLFPKWIYKKGFYKEDSYRGYKGQFYELGTYSKCGHCQICINEKCNNWVVRNHYESKMHEKKSFITLTYEENPIIIVRKDLQDFMKRLRIHLDRTGKEKIRMFGCMEYGELNHRPHGHVILYGYEDENANYLTINKKRNLVLKSNEIQKIWGLGRTSYQEFGDCEIPYLTLYDTPQLEFSKAYKLTAEKIKTLKEYAMSSIRFHENQRKNLHHELVSLENELKQEKSKYKLVKEFMTWSKALGWEQFYEEYSKQKYYTFTEYIQDKEFVTPTPWVKKLANMGDVAAIKEMYKRQEMINQSINEEEERLKSEIRIERRRKNDIMEWNNKKIKLEIL